ncbi:MAG: hypothetical protein GKR99_11055 [Rhodobacteraceae bacterium]|nr:hypothetical protein [Paracoccaceae bacterium]
MRHDDIPAFLGSHASALQKGPVAVILVEDPVEVDSTIRHHLACGFASVLVLAPPTLELADDLDDIVHVIGHNTAAADAAPAGVNPLISRAKPGTWFYYGYNAEYLFYPFRESRTVAEMLAFHVEERRDAMLTYVVDLYAADLGAAPNAVSLEDAHLDSAGYYALARHDAAGAIQERQLDFFGGLKWRFEEHTHPKRRRIDRIGLFRAGPGVRLLSDHRMSVAEMNTFACPWHNNMTAAVASFRTAKALKANAGSTFEIEGFHWAKSVRFDWTSQQLMDLGLMEPGKWF